MDELLGDFLNETAESLDLLMIVLDLDKVLDLNCCRVAAYCRC